VGKIRHPFERDCTWTVSDEKGAWDRLLPGDLAEKFDMAKKVPLKRVGDHQELANLAAYLVSDFSAYINGEVVVIDRRRMAQRRGTVQPIGADS